LADDQELIRRTSSVQVVVDRTAITRLDLKVSSMSQLVACQATGVLWRRARALMRRLILALNDSYRPERHYMRGPGPKCRAKDERTSSHGDLD